MNAKLPPLNSRPRPVVGRTSAVLLLGMLGGLWAGQSISAAAWNGTMPLMIAGLMISVAWAKFSEFLTRQAKCRASHQAARELERRIERLVPRRRMMAHRPHKREESESTWMPVARRSRSVRLQS